MVSFHAGHDALNTGVIQRNEVIQNEGGGGAQAAPLYPGQCVLAWRHNWQELFIRRK
jgi:hypothetical protein